MNRILYRIKSNIFPFFVAVVLFSACCAAMYYFHPSSPYHERYSFVVSYDAIGTLSPGNRVQVRGITKGEITKVELTDDAVFVTARVLADAKIPVNSEYRLINAGLMGEREMCVLTGDAREYISDGDTVIGHYDEGMSGVFNNLEIALESWSDIKTALLALKDSVTIGSIGAKSKRVAKKGEKLLNTSMSAVAEWKEGAISVLDNCDSLITNTKAALLPVQDKADNLEGDVRGMVDRIDTLLNHVRQSKMEFDAVITKLDGSDNSAALILSENGIFAQTLEKFSKDIDALMNDLKKEGVKINVDIF